VGAKRQAKKALELERELEAARRAHAAKAAKKTAKAERAQRAAANWEAMSPAGRRNASIATGVVFALVVGGIAWSASKDDSEGASAPSAMTTSKISDETHGEGGPFAAHDICKKFVRDRLKAPSSAKFGGFEKGDAVGGDGQYVVREHVDSENSFGAKLRSNYTCEVKVVDGTWQLVSLTGIQ
jgi:hypothetical protein